MNKQNTIPESDPLEMLVTFLNELCRRSDDNSFVFALAHSGARWSTVIDLLSDKQRDTIDKIAFKSKNGGFSPANLKVHYVLDEDFINGGSAIVLFSIVGSEWTHLVHVADQNRFMHASIWLEGGRL